MTALEPALPVHMNQIWGFNAEKVGLVFIAAVVPSFVSTCPFLCLPSHIYYYYLFADADEQPTLSPEPSQINSAQRR